MIGYEDLPAIGIRALSDGAVRIAIGPEAMRDDATRGRVDAAWREHARTHPRDYDGMILAFDGYDEGSRTMRARRERYRYLAVGAGAGCGTRLLAVTGVVTGVDQDGDECVLLGRRSGETRIYGGLWELAPSGGVKCPAESVTELSIGDVRRALMEEGLEELGVSLEEAEVRALALVGDDEAASEDVLLRVRLRGAINSRWMACRTQDAGAWEYVDTAWVPIERLGAWVRERPGAVIPPSVAVLRWLGWA